MTWKQQWVFLVGAAALILVGGFLFARPTSWAGGPGPAFGWGRGMMGRGWGPGGMMGGGGGMMNGYGSMMGGGGAEEIPEAPADPDAPRSELTVSIQEWKMVPAELKVEAGKRLVLTVRNDGALPHNFVIPELGVRLVSIAPGASRVIELNADKPGTYEFFCDIPGHAQAGQKGILTVVE